MADKLTLEQIREFWTGQARAHGLSAAASWSDTAVIELEISQILDRLEEGDRVLDVGCANGYSTIRYAAEKRVAVRGVDYIPEMIEQARVRAGSTMNLRNPSKVSALGPPWSTTVVTPLRMPTRSGLSPKSPDTCS